MELAVSLNKCESLLRSLLRLLTTFLIYYQSVPVYGAGQIISSYRGHEVIEHTGGVPGFTSLTARLPDDNLGIVLLSNDWLSLSALETIKWRFVDDIVVRAAAPNSPLIDWNGR